MQKILKIRDLPEPASYTEQGPILSHEGGSAVLRISSESLDQQGDSWIVIHFEKALGIRVTPDFAITMEMLQAQNAIVRVEESAWIVDLKRATNSGPNFEELSLHHFMLLVDKYGCYEIIAESFDISSE